jgi:hypothetical protein
MTSWTPARPRRTRLRRNSRQNASVSAAPTSMPMTPADLRRPRRRRPPARGARPGRRRGPSRPCVQPQVRVGALQRPLPERGDLLVQATAQPRDLILGHPGQPQRLHQPVDLAGRHPVDIRLLDDGDQRLLTAAAGLQEAGEVAALPQLGDGQLDRAHPGVPGPLPIAVTARHPVAATLAVAGASPLGDLGLHQLLGQPAHGLAQHIGVLIGQHLADQLAHAHPAHVGHRGAPPVGSEAPTILSPRWPTYRPDSRASDTTKRDATRQYTPRNCVAEHSTCASMPSRPRLARHPTDATLATTIPTRAIS